jgi:hypothetical protein
MATEDLKGVGRVAHVGFPRLRTPKGAGQIIPPSSRSEFNSRLAHVPLDVGK